MHRFVVMVNGKLKTYTNFNDIPENIDHVIEFQPEIPPAPHTEEQHREMSSWNDKLQLLMQRERNGS